MKNKDRISRRDFIKTATAGVVVTGAILGGSDSKVEAAEQKVKSTGSGGKFKVAAVVVGRLVF